ncbi:methyltransferase, TIGR04325 family [Rhizobium aegyptiacum]|uniref:methyltransferase, TIGR04325 family n=1 Tax=Rhizobium aegyptiacum TaxID=1764550 RepID=UPI0007E54AEE|nr:methyltransferase, TIGR04325 family [Rhizobium aegyptiacum]
MKAFTPPIVLTAVQKLRSGRNPVEPVQPGSMFSGNYASFEEAARKAVGYDDPNAGAAAATRLAAMIAGTNPVEIDGRFQQVHSALCIVRERLQKPRISVLDFGGGSGNYYFRLKDYFPEGCLDWTVVETPNMVQACAPIGSGHVTYLTDIPDGQQYDVAVVSGTLQYLPDAYGWLDRIMSAAKWVILTRLPVRDAPDDKFMVQTVPSHIHNGSMPVEMFSESKMRTAIETGGRIEQTWLVALDEGSLASVGAKPLGFLIQTRKTGLL